MIDRKWTDLAKDIADETNLPKKDIIEIVKLFCEKVADHVTDMPTETKFRLPLLGVFKIKLIPERERINPNTGEKFIKGETHKVKFHISSSLKHDK